MFSFLLMSIMEITHLATEISKYILMMLFYRNLFLQQLWVGIFFANNRPASPSRSHSITIIQMCSPTCPKFSTSCQKNHWVIFKSLMKSVKETHAS